jgi:hypothetical protein
MKEVNARDVVLGVKKTKSLDELAGAFKMDKDVLAKTIGALKEEGYGIDLDGEVVIRRGVPEGPSKKSLVDRFGRHMKFGLVSDTHFGNNHARQDALEGYYDVAEKEGVKEVLMCGDILDGTDIFPGQLSEQKLYGQDAQVDDVIKNYPRRKRMTTHFITGNHDLRQFERGGSDPGRAIGKRADLDYLGQLDAKVQLAEGVDIEIIHPAGGPAYAISYRLQKTLSGREPDDLPSIYAQGHFHQAFYGHYKGTETVSVPSFKDDGLWERRLGFSSVVGGWIVEADITDDGQKIRRFRPELVNFRQRRNT